MINAIELFGNWDKGYAVDKHIIKSEYMGDDIYGQPRYKTKRTELGELLYQFKNHFKYENINRIMEFVNPFLDNWIDINDVDIIIPIPPSDQRIYQPTYVLAELIANYLNKYSVSDVLIQRTDVYGKKKIEITKKANQTFNALLVDDLYRTGATMNVCVKTMREDEYLNKIYVLAITIRL